MKQNLAPIRPAMTAIAAVIALSSTPLLAQEATPADVQSVPAVAAPAPAIEAAAPPVAAAPDVAPATPAASPQPAMKTMSTPVEHVVDTPAASLTTGAGEAAPVRRQAPATAPHRTSAPSAAPIAATPAATHAAPLAKTTAPAAPQPAAAPAAAPAPAAPAAAVTSSTTQSRTTSDDTLPIAGAVVFGLLAAGAAFAMRGKRRDEDELVLDTPTQPAPVVTAEPIIVAPMAAAPVAAASVSPAEGPTKLPNGFDLSRFGRHTRAAYLGPTPDNPSLSLKRRLKRASFFDQREREASASGAAPLKEPVYARSEASQAAQADNGQVTVRLSPERKRSRFGYILQR